MSQHEFVDENFILGLLDIQASGPQAIRIVDAIYKDSFIHQRALDLAANEYVPQVLAWLTGAEKAALRKQFGAEGTSDRPVPRFFVALTPDYGNKPPRPYICGHLGQPGTPGHQSFAYDGPPNGAESIVWLGAKIPEVVISEYAKKYNPEAAPTLGVPLVQPRETHYPQNAANNWQQDPPKGAPNE